MLDHIFFDTTDADTKADTHTIGAILYDKVNDRLGVINAAQELLVHDQDILDQLTTGVVVTAADLDIRDLLHTQDSVRLGDGTSFITSGDGDSDNVANTFNAFDSRSFIYGYDVTGDNWDRLQTDGSGSLNVNITDAMITVEDVAVADISIAAAKEAANVANTAQVAATTLTTVKYREIYNNDNKKMYIGGVGVTDGTGYPISPGAYRQFRASENVDLYWVSAKAGHDVRTLELN